MPADKDFHCGRATRESHCDTLHHVRNNRFTTDLSPCRHRLLPLGCPIKGQGNHRSANRPLYVFLARKKLELLAATFRKRRINVHDAPKHPKGVNLLAAGADHRQKSPAINFWILQSHKCGQKTIQTFFGTTVDYGRHFVSYQCLGLWQMIFILMAGRWASWKCQQRSSVVGNLKKKNKAKGLPPRSSRTRVASSKTMVSPSRREASACGDSSASVSLVRNRNSQMCNSSATGWISWRTVHLPGAVICKTTK